MRQIHIFFSGNKRKRYTTGFLEFCSNAIDLRGRCGQERWDHSSSSRSILRIPTTKPAAPCSQCSLCIFTPTTLGQRIRQRGTVLGWFHPRKTKANQINSLNICLFNSFCDFTVGNRFCTYHIRIHTDRGSLVCTHTHPIVLFIK